MIVRSPHFNKFIKIFPNNIVLFFLCYILKSRFHDGSASFKQTDEIVSVKRVSQEIGAKDVLFKFLVIEIFDAVLIDDIFIQIITRKVPLEGLTDFETPNLTVVLFRNLDELLNAQEKLHEGQGI